MYLLNGIDKLITTIGTKDGEWFAFHKPGYYKIDLVIALDTIKDTYAQVCVKDSKEKIPKLLNVIQTVADTAATTAAASFLLKAEKNYSIKVTYQYANLNTSFHDKFYDGTKSSILITKIS